MMNPEDPNPASAVNSVIEWGVASQSFDGKAESGDQYLVEMTPSGALVAVVDGLGHGPRAATAGKVAVSVMQQHARDAIIPLVKRCHEELKRTRGAVMSVAALDIVSKTMTWLGIGNVKGLLLCADEQGGMARERLLLRGGVVGYNLPTLRPSVLPLKPGDTLIFATDGLRSVFTEDLTLHDSPQRMADQIMAEYRRGTDDAMVLVVRYKGNPPPHRAENGR